MYKGAIDVSTISDETKKPLIIELQSKVNRWLEVSTWYQYSHWVLGAIGVLTSSLSASSLLNADGGRQIASVCSAACIGILGFLNPQKRSSQFLKAFRFLEPAIKRFAYADLTKTELLDIHSKAEGLLNDEEPSSSK